MLYQIVCIIKSHPEGGHSHITAVGLAGVAGLWTVDQVVTAIDGKLHSFYVVSPTTGKTANVGVVREPGRRPYIRTYADGIWNDNLLSLNFCPLRQAA